jgi:RNA polymerase-binding transcription factor DksA
MDTAKHAHFVEMLLEERLRITRALDRIAAMSPTADRAAVGREPGDDAIVGSAGSWPDDDAAIAARESLALADIDEALQILHEEPSRYGICATCGEPIALGRLELVPATRYCERHAS